MTTTTLLAPTEHLAPISLAELIVRAELQTRVDLGQALEHATPQAEDIPQHSVRGGDCEVGESVDLLEGDRVLVDAADDHSAAGRPQVDRGVAGRNGHGVMVIGGKGVE